MIASTGVVLVVEDDEATAELERRALLRAGIQAVVVSRVRDALDLLANQRFSAVVLDYHLPDGDAWPVVEAAEAMRPRIPVILVTGHGNELIASQALQRGVASYVKKSGSFWELLPNSLARITDMVEATERLRASEERFRLMVESVKDHAIFMLDPSGCVTTWSEGAERLMGYSAEEILAKHFSVFYPDEMRAEGKPQRELEVASAGGRCEDEGWRLGKGGKPFFANVVISAIRDEAGQLQGFVKVTRDITQRRNSAQRLQEVSSLLTCVLDAASEVSLISTDPDLNITVFNRGAEHLLGFSSEEVVGRATLALFHDANEIRARAQELSQQHGYPVEGGAVFTEPSTLRHTREWTYIRKDGERVAVSLVVTVMHNSDGGILGYLGTAHDITRQAQYEASLREATSQAKKANGAKSEFLANMSHEIRTPLNAVIGLGYLLEQTSVTEEQQSFLRKINFAGRSLLSVINNVLDLSKIEAGEMLLEDGSLDLKHLVHGIGQMLTPSAHTKGIALVVRCAPDLPARVRGDATRLGQIVTNLLHNAIKFTDTGQVELTLSCSKMTVAGLLVRLSVRDSGIGIAPEALPRLFVPFSQADTSTIRRFGGTGLGLSIARRLVDMMGGEIGVTSSVGAGSEFWVEISLRIADAADPLLERRPANTEDSLGACLLAGVTILVVDDSDINCEVAQLILRRHGATVATSGTGIEALERLRETPHAFEIVLMDVQMPDMDGNEATRRIRNELHLTLPIIALTAGALVSERERSLQAGMNDFLTKPFEPVALIGIVRRHLDRNRMALH